MKILIIGNGGREHAFAWKIAQIYYIDHIFVAPGNAGTAAEPKTQNIDISVTDIDALLQFAASNAIDLTIIGPELPLSLGIVDAFQKYNLPIFGPTQKATQLESSKAYCKAFMNKYKIPTAQYQTFTAQAPDKAYAYIQKQTLPIVIKASGLAQGKGVIIAYTQEEAKNALQRMFESTEFGISGNEVIIEEFLEGTEASFIALCDGKTALPMASSQDHKQRDDGDKGPNTGGMGAISPSPILTPARIEEAMKSIVLPTLAGMQAENHPFTGFLYAGLMITPKGDMKVLEFNVRMGDPETQPILMRLKTDFIAHLQSALQQTLSHENIQWSNKHAVGVVLAAKGYPHTYEKNIPLTMTLINTTEGNKTFHAGTQNTPEGIVSTGGRVLCATSLGDTLKAAIHNAYHLTHQIAWPSAYYRNDIGQRENKKVIKLRYQTNDTLTTLNKCHQATPLNPRQ